MGSDYLFFILTFIGSVYAVLQLSISDYKKYITTHIIKFIAFKKGRQRAPNYLNNSYNF